MNEGLWDIMQNNQFQSNGWNQQGNQTNAINTNQ